MTAIAEQAAWTRPPSRSGAPHTAGQSDGAIRTLLAELVEVRPTGPADTAAVRAFLAGLSAESAYKRFFTGVGSPSATLVRRLVEVDHDRRETLLALLGDEVIGMADTARHDDGCTVELGLVVTDPWQGHGLGPRLAGAVLDLAVAGGATTLLVHALGDNSRVARMVRRQWPGSVPAVDHGTLTWRLPLA